MWHETVHTPKIRLPGIPGLHTHGVRRPGGRHGLVGIPHPGGHHHGLGFAFGAVGLANRSGAHGHTLGSSIDLSALSKHEPAAGKWGLRFGPISQQPLRLAGAKWGLRFGAALKGLRGLTLPRVSSWDEQLPPPPLLGDWSVHPGALSAGHDMLGSESGRLLSIDEARGACEAAAKCEGFTYLGEPGQGKGVNVYFKTKWNLLPDLKERGKEWRSHRLRSHSPQLPPPLPPAWLTPLLARSRGALAASYDLDHVAQEGFGGALARQWPEYLRGIDHPHFAYPKPREGMLLASIAPRAYYFPEFLTDAESDAIINAATPKLVRSAVAKGPNDTQTEEQRSKIRTSHGAWLSDDHPATKALRDKIMDIIRLDRNAFEAMQVLRYEAGSGEKYEPHWDYFPHSGYGFQAANRIATFITFLSTVEPGAGGETVLPHAMGLQPPQGTIKGPGGRETVGWCTSGLRVRPVKGSGILVYAMRRNMAFDAWSQHGGCPHYGKGQKWIAPQWIRLQLPPEGLPPESRSGWGM